MNRLFLLLLPALLSGAAGCMSPDSGRNAGPACCASAGPAREPSGKSIYENASLWETDAGEKIKLADLAGRPQIAAMFYSSCHVACPVTIETLKEIERRLPRDSRSKVGFLLITFDPEADTPAALRSFRKMQRLSARWALLRGAAGGTKSVADELGVSFEKGSYRVVHSSGIVLLDSEGKVISRLEGLHPPVADFVEAVKAALPREMAKLP